MSDFELPTPDIVKDIVRQEKKDESNRKRAALTDSRKQTTKRVANSSRNGAKGAQAAEEVDEACEDEALYEPVQQEITDYLTAELKRKQGFVVNGEGVTRIRDITERTKLESSDSDQEAREKTMTALTSSFQVVAQGLRSLEQKAAVMLVIFIHVKVNTSKFSHACVIIKEFGW